MKYASAFCTIASTEVVAFLFQSCDGKQQPDPGKEQETPVLVEEIRIDPESLALTVGETGQLEASVLPENAGYGEILWTSSDESVAIVDRNGLVTALAKGTATVTATEDSSKVTATCEVTVSGIPVESVTLDKTELEMRAGDTETLTATVNPVNADDSEVSWTSSDEAVASVSQNGEVTALGAGNAIITAEAGGITAECSVTVISPAALWDYYYEDGTWSTELDPSKTAIGIIYAVNEDGQSGRIVSLDEYTGQWSTEDYETGATSDSDGKSNMETIKSISGWENSFPLFKWCADKTQGGLEWYIPAKKELRQMFAGISGLVWVESGAISSQGEVNDWGDYTAALAEYASEREAFNERVKAVPGATGFNMSEIYWASDEMDETLKWAVEFRSGNTTFQFCDAQRLGRAIAKF